jgi:hypothetical protein
MLQRRTSSSRRYLRRALQIVAFVGTIFVGIVALSVIVSQTPWFKDWLRRFVVREGSQYLNGTLTIGSMGGNLFTGVELGDVAIDVNGEHVVTLKKVEIRYRLSDLIANGTTVEQIRVESPYVRLRHTAGGWNVARLPKKQSEEANRQGPGRSLTLSDIEIADGRVDIDDRAPSPSYNLPRRISDLDLKGAFSYEPVHYSATIDRLSVTAASPDLRVASLTGRIGTRDDDLHLENVRLKTAGSTVAIDGVVGNYLRTPQLNMTVTTPGLSVPEFAGVVPALKGYDLHPQFTLKTSGPLDRLRVSLDERSEAGAITANVTTDVQAPGFGAQGDVSVRSLNLAPLLRDPAQRSDITAHAALDVRLASAPESNAPGTGPSALSRARGTFSVDAPKVVAAGYAATKVKADGRLDGRRITIDARADAYGGSAAAKGLVVPAEVAGGPLQFDVTGSASHLNLARLPASVSAPRVATNINADTFHLAGETGRRRTAIDGSVTLGRSTIQGGSITAGTEAAFHYANRGPKSTPDVSYSARGGVRDVDLQAVGQAFQVAAIAKPEYASRINLDFTARGSGTASATMTLDASGTVADTEVMGGTVPHLAFDAHVADGAANARVNGSLRGFNPARITGTDAQKGTVNADVDATVRLTDLTAPISPRTVAADGRVTLANTTLANLKIDSATIDGQYAGDHGELRQLAVKGPNLDVQASGPVALGDTGSSNVKFHAAASDLAHLASLAGVQGVKGSAIVDGTLTGNAQSLRATGTLDGANVGYQQNSALDLNSTFTVTVPNLQFENAAVHADTTGSLIKAGGLTINDLHATTTYADRRLDFKTHVTEPPPPQEAGKAAAAPRALDLSGSVELGANGRKEIRVPHLAVSALGATWTTAEGAEPTIDYGDNRLVLNDVRFVNGSQSIAVNGEFPLDGNTTPGALTVEAQHVDLAQIDQLAMLNRGIAGTLDANVRVTGTTAAPAVQGHVSVAKGGFAKFTYQSLTADASYDQQRITLDATLTQAPGVQLTAKGTIPTAALSSTNAAAGAGEQIDMRVQSSRIDLAMVQSFTTAVTNVGGTLEADVHVTGTAHDPRFSGFVDIAGGRFDVPDASTSFSGLTTKIQFDPNVVRIPQFRILDEHGDALTIGGQLAMHEGKAGAVNVSLDADQFKLMDNELGDVHVETHLKLTGDVHAPRIEGEVRMDQARLELDRILLQIASPYSEEALPEVLTAEEAAASPARESNRPTDTAIAAGRQARGQRPRTTNPALEQQNGIGQTGALAPIAMNVHLVVPDNMVVRGQDLRPGGPTAMQIGSLNATLGADLRIRKGADRPLLIRGTARTVRGFYEFQGRRFELVRDGQVQFLGLPEINPTLDVSATRLIPNTGVTARIHVTGTMRAPELNLSSDPPLDESDILSLIIFNRNVNELGTGQRASLAETAGGIASGFIAAPLSRSVGKALDVDLFEITTTDPQTGETAGGVTLGKQVNDKTFVKFRQQFGQHSFTQFELEYDLSRFLRVQTTVAPETTSAANRLTQRRIERAGIDLIFVFSY